jgi:hypothetical protein
MPYIVLQSRPMLRSAHTVDTAIGNMPVRVTLLTDKILRIEPDDVGTISTATTEDGVGGGRWFSHAAGSRSVASVRSTRHACSGAR